MSRRAMAGIDIGGAHLKAAHAGGAALSAPFAVWRDPAALEGAIAALLARLPRWEALAVTTTAELCDCYPAKAEGVREVLGACARAVGLGQASALRIWRVDADGGRFVGLADALADPLPVAAGNWLALATWAAAALVPGQDAILADMGSTTTDLIPLRGSRAAACGLSDFERLQSGALVYTGLRRTPVFAHAPELRLRGETLPCIPELFATLGDAHLLAGNVPEDAADCETADGRPRLAPQAQARLARCLGLDGESLSESEARDLASQIVHAQAQTLERGLRRLGASRSGWIPRAAVLAGEGEEVVGRAIASLWPRCELLSLRARLSPAASQAACAHALVELLSAEGERGARG